MFEKSGANLLLCESKVFSPLCWSSAAPETPPPPQKNTVKKPCANFCFSATRAAVGAKLNEIQGSVPPTFEACVEKGKKTV
jgi:hypothetical protein